MISESEIRDWLGQGGEIIEEVFNSSHCWPQNSPLRRELNTPHNLARHLYERQKFDSQLHFVLPAPTTPAEAQ